MNYIPKYKITSEKLRQQYISGQIISTTVKQYPEWLRKRADELAKAGNEFFDELRGNLKLPEATVELEREEHAFAAA